MRKEIINKERILKIILVIVYSIFVIMFVTVAIKEKNGNSTYKITKIGCNSKNDSNTKSEEDVICKTAGYYIDNDKVNISLGRINCANDIKIEKIEVDDEMNVYIKVKEKKGKNQAKCVCNPSINIQFNEEVNNVTLVTEDGTELGEC